MASETKDGMASGLDRRSFIRLACCASAAGLVGGSPLRASSGRPRPNVLLILADDLRPELGCYGVGTIQTPRIDRLAAEGTCFERAYCAQGVCNPSRVSLLTGLRPDTHRVGDNETHFRRFLPAIWTLPQVFKNHGYVSAGLGKIFHGILPDPVSWTRSSAPPGDFPIYMSAETRDRQARREQKARDQGFSTAWIDAYLRGPAVEASETPDSAHWDGALTGMALASLKELKGAQPFFLGVGFVKPHLPYVAPQKYWDLYKRDEIPRARTDRLPHGAPPFAINNMTELASHEGYVGVPNPAEGRLDDERSRLLKHGYYACVSFVDAQVGRLLDALAAEGLRDSTIVVLVGDNGYKLGEHGSWGKMTNYEVDVRVPLIIAAPGQKTRGRSSPALVELVDLYATLCDLAGLKPPHPLEGTSLVPLLDDPARPWKKAAFSQYARGFTNRFMGRSMRTDRFRYIEWRDRIDGGLVAAELYDHAVDPDEDLNIAEEPASKELVAGLARELAAGWRAARASP